MRPYNSGQMSQTMYITNPLTSSNMSPIYQQSKRLPIHSAVKLQKKKKPQCSDTTFYTFHCISDCEDKMRPLWVTQQFHRRYITDIFCTAPDHMLSSPNTVNLCVAFSLGFYEILPFHNSWWDAAKIVLHGSKWATVCNLNRMVHGLLLHETINFSY